MPCLTNKYQKDTMRTKILLLLMIFVQQVFAQTIPVTLHYSVPDQLARNIYIAGEFNNWSSNDPNFRITDTGQNGFYTKTIDLNPGTYLYKYVIDKTWFPDPNNPVTDGSVNNNSILTVSDPMITYLLPFSNLVYQLTQPPVIQAIVAFGNSTSVNISNLSLKINNKTVALSANSYNSANKTFTYQPTTNDLIEGENSAEFKISTPLGNASRTIKFTISSLPVFEILTEDMLYTNPNIVIYGKLADLPTSPVNVNVNGTGYSASITSDSLFYLPATLIDGANQVVVSVTNGNGTSTKSQTLEYRSNKRPAVNVQASVSGRVVTLSANATSPIGRSLSYQWSQPNAVPSNLLKNELTTSTIQVVIPIIKGEYFIKVKATDSDGNYNLGGCLIKSTLNGVSIVGDESYPEWVNNLILYEISPNIYNKTTTALAGISSKIDHIDSLGINAIWFTPIFDSEGGGYSTRNYYKIKESVGTKEELKAFVELAHSRGIRVILDLPFNNSWTEHPFFKNVVNLKTLSPYADYYYWSGEPGISGYHHYYDWSFGPSFNVSNSNLIDYLYNVAEYWLRECDLDGYRYDVAWGVELRDNNFWSGLRARLKKIKPNIFLLGESPINCVYENNTLDAFDNKLDAGYDWDLRGFSNTGLPAVFTGSASIDELHQIVTATFPHNAYPMRFIENHDHPRAVTEFGIEKSKLAHAVVLTTNGIPLIYGGAEMGETGNLDTPMTWDEDAELIPYFQKLIEIRNKYFDNKANVMST
jgi:glycosidase